MDENELTFVGKLLKYGGGLIGILVLFLMFKPFVTVSPGERGIITHFGRPDNVILTEGFHWRVPIYDSVQYMDVKVQKEEIEADAVSRDMQKVSSRVAVNFHVDDGYCVDLFKTVGFSYPSKIIAPAIQESVKSTTAKYTAEELITKRETVAQEIKVALANKLKPFIIVDALNMTNFGFSAEFDQAIEQKQVAEQNALKAKRDLDRIKIEAEQQIATARAEAEAFKLKSQQLTPIMVQMEAIKKWDGKYPTTIVGGDSVPMIQLPQSAAATK